VWNEIRWFALWASRDWERERERERERDRESARKNGKVEGGEVTKVAVRTQSPSIQIFPFRCPHYCTNFCFIYLERHRTVVTPPLNLPLYCCFFICSFFCYFIPGTLTSVSIKRNIFFLPCVAMTLFFLPCYFIITSTIFIFIFSPSSPSSASSPSSSWCYYYYYFAEVGSLR